MPAYGLPRAYFHDLDPAQQLVHRCCRTDAKRREGRRLRVAAPISYLGLVRDATSHHRTSHHRGNLAGAKAPRIQHVLRLITDRPTGDLSLALPERPEPCPMREPGSSNSRLGPKTSAACGRSARCGWRHCRRLPPSPRRAAAATDRPKCGRGAGALDLGRTTPPGLYASTGLRQHEVMMFHGQRCCFHAAPACDRCPLRPLPTPAGAFDDEKA